MLRVGLVAVVLVGTAPGVAVGAAVADGGAVTVGQNSSTMVLSCGSPVLYVQDAVAGGAPYTTPAGVVTSWTIVVPSTIGATVKLKTLHEGPADTYTIQRSSEVGKLATTGANTFASRIPVAAGDSIALFAVTTSTTPCVFATGQAGDQFGSFIVSSEPATGDSVVFSSFSTGYRVNVSATVEPDADGDGFGDVTQDRCPSHTGSVGDCQPPDTGFGKVKKRIVTNGARAKVKLPLTSTEPATFTCSVDGRTPKACTSPYRLRLAPGRHDVYVTSTDAAGNTDVTAATLRLRVVRRDR
jgi:hypothetical protein